jgi:hypothetical protein
MNAKSDIMKVQRDLESLNDVQLGMMGAKAHALKKQGDATGDILYQQILTEHFRRGYIEQAS